MPAGKHAVISSLGDDVPAAIDDAEPRLEVAVGTACQPACDRRSGFTRSNGLADKRLARGIRRRHRQRDSNQQRP